MHPLPPNIIIRPATPADVPALGHLGASLMRVHHAFDERRFLAPGDHPEVGYSHFLLSQLDAADTHVLVAERQSPDAAAQLVGYVYAGIEPRSWKELRDEAGFIHDLLVNDDTRGSGVGQHLLDAAITWLRSRGLPRAVLWTAAPNEGAHHLFASRGFRPTMIEMTLEL